MEMSCQRHAPATLSSENKSLNRKTGGSQSLYGLLETRKLLAPAGIQTPNHQPVTKSLYVYKEKKQDYSPHITLPYM